MPNVAPFERSRPRSAWSVAGTGGRAVRPGAHAARSPAPAGFPGARDHGARGGGRRM